MVWTDTELATKDIKEPVFSKKEHIEEICFDKEKEYFAKVAPLGLEAKDPGVGYETILLEEREVSVQPEEDPTVAAFMGYEPEDIKMPAFIQRKEDTDFLESLLKIPPKDKILTKENSSKRKARDLREAREAVSTIYKMGILGFLPIGLPRSSLPAIVLGQIPLETCPFHDEETKWQFNGRRTCPECGIEFIEKDEKIRTPEFTNPVIHTSVIARLAKDVNKDESKITIELVDELKNLIVMADGQPRGPDPYTSPRYTISQRPPQDIAIFFENEAGFYQSKKGEEVEYKWEITLERPLRFDRNIGERVGLAILQSIGGDKDSNELIVGASNIYWTSLDEDFSLDPSGAVQRVADNPCRIDKYFSKGTVLEIFGRGIYIIQDCQMEDGNFKITLDRELTRDIEENRPIFLYTRTSKANIQELRIGIEKFSEEAIWRRPQEERVIIVEIEKYPQPGALIAIHISPRVEYCDTTAELDHQDDDYFYFNVSDTWRQVGIYPQVEKSSELQIDRSDVQVYDTIVPLAYTVKSTGAYLFVGNYRELFERIRDQEYWLEDPYELEEDVWVWTVRNHYRKHIVNPRMLGGYDEAFPINKVFLITGFESSYRLDEWYVGDHYPDFLRDGFLVDTEFPNTTSKHWLIVRGWYG